MKVNIRFRKYKPRYNPHEHPFMKDKSFTLTTYKKNSAVATTEFVEEEFEVNDEDIVRIDFLFESFLKYEGVRYSTIKIHQSFWLQWDDNPYLDERKFNLVPYAWYSIDSKQQGVHPLLSINNASGTLEIDCLVIDLTRFWYAAHKENAFYKLHDLYWEHDEIELRVFAHLAGPPLIWYVCIPVHVRKEPKITPHIFYCPADFTESQPGFFSAKHNEEHKLKNFGPSDLDYLNNGINGLFKKDGSNLMEYLIPPFQDEDIVRRSDEIYSAIAMDAKRYRNVLLTTRILKSAALKNKPQPLTWRCWAGLEKAFVGNEKSKPKQVLMLPQRPKDGNNTYATSGDLQFIVKNICRILAADGILFNFKFDEQCIDKYVLSCFSQSGVDLWDSSLANISRIKAIIAIEPQNLPSIMNIEGDKLGYKVIQQLLTRKIEVFLIGRNNEAHFGVPLSETEKSKIIFLPTAERAKKIFAYPPDINNSDFIKYRVSRLLDPSSDPLMTKFEKEIFDELKAKGLSDKDIFKLIFHPVHKIDKTQDDDVQSWYAHAFSLNGGDDIRLPVDKLYGKNVSYNTFFQTCVQKIG